MEVVQPVANPEFCMACHRIRLTSSGLLKGCLMTNRGLVDLRPALRAEVPPEALVPFFEAVIRSRRPYYTYGKGGQVETWGDESVLLPMAKGPAAG